MRSGGSAVWGLSSQQNGGEILFSWSGESGELVAALRPSDERDAYRILVPDVAVDDWHTYRIEANEDGATFFVDNEIVATHSGGIPASDMLNVRISAFSRPGSSQLIRVDSARLAMSDDRVESPKTPTAMAWQPYPTATPGLPADITVDEFDNSTYLLFALPLIDYEHYEDIMEVYSVVDKHIQDWGEISDLETQYILNTICWAGTLNGQAETVMEACNSAVEIDPTAGAVRDSRGVAGLMIGGESFQSQSLSDFRVFVEWAESYSGSADQAVSEDMIARRKQWIDALENGRNPLSEEQLAELRQNENMSFNDALGTLMPFGLSSGEISLVFETVALLHFDYHTEVMELLPLIRRIPQDLELRPSLLEMICIDGSLAGSAEEVLEACSLAVDLPESENSTHLGLGVARALADDYDGAIAEFKLVRAYLLESAEESTDRMFVFEVSVEDIERWIDSLNEGKVPFTEADHRNLVINIFSWGTQD